MAEVELRSVRKLYPGGVEAVKGIDLAIPDGALCVLVGPSGCGKSTLLRMIAGLETISEGEAAIDGRVVNRLEPAERDIAMVFQNYALYPHMTVYNNMAYGLRNRGFDRAAITAKVGEAARVLAIEELLERRPRQLSGGQRQRVAMGRAIVRDPKVFLFDEPLSNLDAKLRVQMRIEIRRLQESLGTTSVYVTHDQLEAMTLADMLVVMNEGRVEQIGPPMEVYETPLTPFVAAFIGSPSMNLLPAVSTGEGARLTGHGGGPVTAPLGHAGDVLVGVRPEHIGIGEPPRDTGLALAMEVAVIEPVGSESFVHGRLENGEMLVVRVTGKPDFGPGDRVNAHAPAHALHLFAAETGRRIAPRAAAA